MTSASEYDDTRSGSGRFGAGNPGRRPGSRNRAPTRVAQRLLRDFEAHADVLFERWRTHRPGLYLRLIALAMPKAAELDLDSYDLLEGEAPKSFGDGRLDLARDVIEACATGLISAEQALSVLSPALSPAPKPETETETETETGAETGAETETGAATGADAGAPADEAAPAPPAVVDPDAISPGMARASDLNIILSNRPIHDDDLIALADVRPFSFVPDIAQAPSPYLRSIYGADGAQQPPAAPAPRPIASRRRAHLS